MDMDCQIGIEINHGGRFGVQIKDPKKVENNKEADNPWVDPWVEFNFDSVAGVCAFLEEVLPKLQPEDQTTQFDAAYERAMKEDKDED